MIKREFKRDWCLIHNNIARRTNPSPLSSLVTNCTIIFTASEKSRCFIRAHPRSSSIRLTCEGGRDFSSSQHAPWILAPAKIWVMGPTGGRNIPYFFAKEGGVNKDQPGKLGALLWAYRGKRNGFCDGSTCLVMRVERIYGSVLFYEFYIYMYILLYIVKR